MDIGVVPAGVKFKTAGSWDLVAQKQVSQLKFSCFCTCLNAGKICLLSQTFSRVTIDIAC